MEIYPVCFFLYYTPTPLYKSITVCVTDNIIVISKCFNLCVCVFVFLCVCACVLSLSVGFTETVRAPQQSSLTLFCRAEIDMRRQA